MDVRALLVGSERGAALGIAVGFLAVAGALLVRPPIEPPYASAAPGYLAVVLLYAAPAALVGAYGGGLFVAWAVEAAPAALLWWLQAGAVGTIVGYPTTANRIVGALEVAAVVALVVGTVGFAVGRLLGVAWTRRAAVPA